MMQRIFQHPGWLKFLSVALAILLWAYVMPTYTAETTQAFEVPLYVTPHAEYKVLSGPSNLSTTVRVTATGKRLAVSRLRVDQIRAEVDYSRVTVPNTPQTVEVTVTGPPGVKVTYNVANSPITVTLVEETDELFEVAVEPASGIIAFQGKEYRFKAESDTKQVHLEGRSDFLRRVERTRVLLDTANLEPRMTALTLPAMPVDADGKPVENLEAKLIGVSLTWEELPPSSEFKVNPVTGGTLPSGFVVTNMVVEPKTVRVRAAVLGAQLPDRQVIDTAPIDLTGKTKSFTTAIGLLPPAGVTAELQTVNVTVNVVESSIEKVFRNVPLSVHGDAGGRETTLSITDVHVTVRGPASAVTPLDAGTLGMYVDIEGLRDGKHSLPVKFNTPPGVTQVIVDPAVVEVTIGKQ